MAGEDENPAVPAVHAAAVKLPPFWTENPAIWFYQAESQFAIKNITVEKTKYFYIVASLGAEAALRVASLLEDVPAVDPYATLKKVLLDAYTLTEYQRAEHLANLPPLGDQRPSELLAHIRQLLPATHKLCFRARYDFLSRLPAEIRSTLINSNLELDMLAAAADNLWSAFRVRSSISVVEEDVQLEVAAVGRGQQPRRVQSRPNTGQQPSQRSSGSNRRQYCWYHRNFGEQANDCKDVESGVPCTWPGNVRAGRRRN